MRSEVAILFHFQVCSTCYTTLQTKDRTRSASTSSHYGSYPDNSCDSQLHWSHHTLPWINTYVVVDEVFAVAAVVGKKAHLGLKKH